MCWVDIWSNIEERSPSQLRRSLKRSTSSYILADFRLSNWKENKAGSWGEMMHSFAITLIYCRKLSSLCCQESLSYFFFTCIELDVQKQWWQRPCQNITGSCLSHFYQELFSILQLPNPIHSLYIIHYTLVMCSIVCRIPSPSINMIVSRSNCTK